MSGGYQSPHSCISILPDPFWRFWKAEKCAHRDLHPRHQFTMFFSSTGASISPVWFQQLAIVRGVTIFQASLHYGRALRISTL